jgi:hypothetical protein
MAEILPESYNFPETSYDLPEFREVDFFWKFKPFSGFSAIFESLKIISPLA